MKLEKKLISLQKGGLNYVNVKNLAKGENFSPFQDSDKKIPIENSVPTEIKSKTDFQIINAQKKTSNKQTPEEKFYQIRSKDLQKNKRTYLNDLYQKNKSCQKCELGGMRNNFVFGNGSTESKIMFIGEGPGADEDKLGEPFVGRAGKLLTKMINTIGIERQDVYITNIVKCRPPQNRNPTTAEISCCIPILKKQIQLINPKLIITLGNVPSKTLIPDLPGISRVHGEIFQYKTWKLLPTFHPSYLLRNRAAIPLAWEDFKKIFELAFDKEHIL